MVKLSLRITYFAYCVLRVLRILRVAYAAYVADCVCCVLCMLRTACLSCCVFVALATHIEPVFDVTEFKHPLHLSILSNLSISRCQLLKNKDATIELYRFEIFKCQDINVHYVIPCIRTSHFQDLQSLDVNMSKFEMQ